MKSITKEEIVMAADDVLREKHANLETSKIRDEALAYCIGKGIDIGCADDKIKPDAFGVDHRPLVGVDANFDLNRPLPLDDGTFDYVYSSHCLEHLIDHEAALADWARILKPRGHMVLYLPHADHYKEPNPEHLHEFRSEDIKPVLEGLGFTILVDELDVGENRYSFFLVAQKKEESKNV